ncbi:hypothetical protein HDV00_011538 [Rhizophlyctis rosea]|nr:hypothetical protein HDV00_011538 [Rhizophlyctis rosea]
MTQGTVANEKAGNNEALDLVLQQNRENNGNRPWYRNRGIRNLNLLLLLALITSCTNGYDGSMMNGLQAVENWQNYFNHPHGSILGLLNAIQNIGSIIALPIAPIFSGGIAAARSSSAPPSCSSPPLSNPLHKT